ncbi:N-acetyltransferase [Brevibacillus sp. H7]|uniref:N-acetyltransferase n=1 Tax=Brevibacillus sp. H7 TaxID=3349138 RepID=UPI003819445A
MSGFIQLKKFQEINLNDPFFDSLKADYPGFEVWFVKKASEQAYVYENDQGFLEAFLYLKKEEGPVTDIVPPLDSKTRVKIGTMKINPHGTRLGERFIKKAFDYAVSHGLDELYVTVFPKHAALVNLFKKYGFLEHGKKGIPGKEELVLKKSFSQLTGHIVMDYPMVNAKGLSKYLLSIYPDFHTRLFPDSILKTESFNVIEDVSHTNSIHKVYICKMNGVAMLKQGDTLVIYRTSDIPGRARYRSVATSICVVEEVKSKREFANVQAYLKYCSTYSVFSEAELLQFYSQFNNLYVIKMTYNVALRKRLTRDRLITEIGLEENTYWGFLPLTDTQFELIQQKGDVYEGLVINKA